MRLRHRVLLLTGGLVLAVAVAIGAVAAQLLGQVAAPMWGDPAAAAVLVATERLLWLAVAAIGALGVGLGGVALRLWLVAPVERLARSASAEPGAADEPLAQDVGGVAELITLRQRLRALQAQTLEAEQSGGARLAAIQALLDRSATRLAAVDRLALTGQLALGAAHDLGSPLAIAVACVDSLRYGVVAELHAAATPDAATPDAARHVAAGPDAAARLAEQADRYVSQIDEALGRVDAIVRELNTFGLPSRSAADGHQEVARVSQLSAATVALARLHKKCRRVRLSLVGAEQVADCAAGIPPRHFEQIVLNLIINAADATANQGRVIVELRRAPAAESAAAPSAPALLVTVRDDGPGVAEHLREQLFEPFFTTKAEGVGSGLGLAVSRRLARAAGGDLRLLPADAPSELPAGAAFELRLPLSAGQGGAPA